jgi:hypothetical protein
MAVVISVVSALALVTVMPAGQLNSGMADAASTTPHYATWHRSVDGITLSGLQDFVLSDSIIVMMERQELAARDYWKANTIRLQIEQDRAVGSQGHIWNRHYMYFVRTVVDYGLSIGLTVVLNDQTEISVGFANNEPMPDEATRAFWGRMMALWGNNHKVVFDLFNEPRMCGWGVWLNGGWCQGIHAIGTQSLVDFIRAHANNEIWVEGINWASTLAGVPILSGSGIVYTFHHPGSPHADKKARLTTKILWLSFGYLAAEGYKVLDGEFANYIGNYYWDKNPGPSVRAYLAYLHAHHIGLLCWSLVPGSMDAGAAYNLAGKEPQSDGTIVLHFFQRDAKANRK